MSIKKNEIKAAKLSEALKKNIRRRKGARKNPAAKEHVRLQAKVNNIEGEK